MYSSNEFTSSLTKQLESSEALVISAITLEQYVISATCLYPSFQKRFLWERQKEHLVVLVVEMLDRQRAISFYHGRLLSTILSKCKEVICVSAASPVRSIAA
jgi:hypothetical protein